LPEIAESEAVIANESIDTRDDRGVGLSPDPLRHHLRRAVAGQKLRLEKVSESYGTSISTLRDC